MSDLEDAVYRRLRASIVSHELPPNTRLVEREIAEVLGVSRTPVRAALRRLAYQQLVVLHKHRGATVVQPTMAEIRSAFAVRRMLEPQAASLAAQRIGEEQLRALEECTQRETAGFRNREWDTIIETTLTFHGTIADASGNQFLAKFCREIITQTNVYLIFYDRPLESPRSPGEHLRILQALKGRDGEAAAAAMLAHVDSTEQHLDLSPLSGIRASGVKGLAAILTERSDI
jgi:DNA-binding GntR family transcriptional regulator